MEHELAETTEQRAVRHRDFYNIRKVDTHVHLAVRLPPRAQFSARAILGAHFGAILSDVIHPSPFRRRR
jgi:hypothetical protein